MYKQLRNLTAIVLACAAVASCKIQRSVDTPLRSEKISVYTSENPGVLLNNVQVPFTGVEAGEIHILSDKPLDMNYVVDPTLPEQEQKWFTIRNVEQIAPGHTVVTYDATSIIEDNSLSRRSGLLSLTNAPAYLGKFLTIRQGYTVTYDAGFDAAALGSLSLSGNMVYTTPALNNINLHYYDYISFNAYAQVPTGMDPVGQTFTIDVSIQGAPYFDATGQKSIRLNVPVSSNDAPENLHYLLITNHGERIGAGVKLSFTTNNPTGVIVHFNNLRIYKVSEAELEDLVDDDEEYDPDNENW